MKELKEFSKILILEKSSAALPGLMERFERHLHGYWKLEVRSLMHTKRKVELYFEFVSILRMDVCNLAPCVSLARYTFETSVLQLPKFRLNSRADGVLYI